MPHWKMQPINQYRLPNGDLDGADGPWDKKTSWRAFHQDVSFPFSVVTLRLFATRGFAGTPPLAHWSPSALLTTAQRLILPSVVLEI